MVSGCIYIPRKGAPSTVNCHRKLGKKTHTSSMQMHPSVVWVFMPFPPRKLSVTRNLEAAQQGIFSTTTTAPHMHGSHGQLIEDRFETDPLWPPPFTKHLDNPFISYHNSHLKYIYICLQLNKSAAFSTDGCDFPPT
jgi:hypothetical protein